MCARGFYSPIYVQVFSFLFAVGVIMRVFRRFSRRVSMRGYFLFSVACVRVSGHLSISLKSLRRPPPLPPPPTGLKIRKIRKITTRVWLLKAPKKRSVSDLPKKHKRLVKMMF